jgi:hypothetical protein
VNRWDNIFYENLLRKTCERNYFAVQFSVSHTGLCNGNISLFDLEGVYPIADLPLLQAQHSHFDDVDYGEFVLNRFLSLYPEKHSQIRDRSFLRQRSWRTGHGATARILSPFRLLRAWLGQLRQIVRVKFGKTHAHLIEP